MSAHPPPGPSPQTRRFFQLGLRGYGAQGLAEKRPRMLMPDIDVANATEEEIIAAYMAEGMSRRNAETYTAVLMNPDPRFPID